MPALAASRSDDTADATASAADSVFFGILTGLEHQRFVPGQRLVEVDLAAQFGVGRNSVREALQRLVAEGIVETVRHKGAVIRALTIEDTMDVLDVAERMTGLLARSAARAVAAGAATQPLRNAASTGEREGITPGQFAPEAPAGAMGCACGFPFGTLERAQAWRRGNRRGVNVYGDASANHKEPEATMGEQSHLFGRLEICSPVRSPLRRGCD